MTQSDVIAIALMVVSYAGVFFWLFLDRSIDNRLDKLRKEMRTKMDRLDDRIDRLR